MVYNGFEFSEKTGEPILMRMVTRLAHSRSGVERKEQKPQNEIKVENTVDNLVEDIKKEVEPKQESTVASVETEAPILTQEQEDDEVFSIDVQKELEAKFDELFGPMDDD